MTYKFFIKKPDFISNISFIAVTACVFTNRKPAFLSIAAFMSARAGSTFYHLMITFLDVVLSKNLHCF
ncbi:MAG: hypothetical protein ACTHK0_20000, partial [Ginsengibacter sp.]